MYDHKRLKTRERMFMFNYFLNLSYPFCQPTMENQIHILCDCRFAERGFNKLHKL